MHSSLYGWDFHSGGIIFSVVLYNSRKWPSRHNMWDLKFRTQHPPTGLPPHSLISRPVVPGAEDFVIIARCMSGIANACVVLKCALSPSASAKEVMYQPFDSVWTGVNLFWKKWINDRKLFESGRPWKQHRPWLDYRGRLPVCEYMNTGIRSCRINMWTPLVTRLISML